MKYRIQIASDIIRDGLGVELLGEGQNPVAEVFRSDKDLTLALNTFGNDIPVNILEDLLAYAKHTLEPFEAGKPLTQADMGAWDPHTKTRIETEIDCDA